MFDRIKSLFRNLVIYGMGDVATSLVSLLLLPVYTRFLSPSDYGVIAMLLTVEAVAKVVFRWGVDTAFMRLYYDCVDQPSRQRLASTIFFFLLAVNGALLVLAIGSAGWLSRQLFGSPQHSLLIALVLANTFVGGMYFIPFQVLRIGEKSGQFIALVFARSAGTLVMRLVLVIWAGLGVLGVVLADVAVTIVFTIVLSAWFVPLIRPLFSRAIIRDALGFGLPRIPHAIAQQVISLADRYLLNAYGTLRDVGLYSIGASFGLALKLFLSAFEYAWTPFFLGVMREPDAATIYSTVSTYVVAVLVLLVAGLCAVARDLDPPDHDAAVSPGGQRHPMDRARRDVPGTVSGRIDRDCDHEADDTLSDSDRTGGGREPGGELGVDSPLWRPRRGVGERHRLRHARRGHGRFFLASLSDSLRVRTVAADRGGWGGGVSDSGRAPAARTPAAGRYRHERRHRCHWLRHRAVRDRVLPSGRDPRTAGHPTPGAPASTGPDRGPGTGGRRNGWGARRRE